MCGSKVLVGENEWPKPWCVSIPKKMAMCLYGIGCKYLRGRLTTVKMNFDILIWKTFVNYSVHYDPGK